ncbi:enoyl-CoA hydratase/isomerase family protein [Pseudonocardia sp. UM4_GMWB1]|uniref:enoyl-CoA hydratase/isomerase family protein n=1 Tax=Pseudonocardia sp. UM4_GMWB1 TaxID=2212989 RepID=UPI00307F74E8
MSLHPTAPTEYPVDPPGVRLTRDGPHVAVLTLDHPPANALSAPVRAAVGRALDAVEADTAVRALVLTGVGHFSAGGHLGEERRARDDGTSADFLDGVLRLTDRIEDLRVPVVAAVTGGAVGGGLELALACDIRVAADDAFFVAAGVNVGLIMSVWRLPRLIGLGPAREMLLTGERCDAATALRTGLVGTVVPARDLLRTACGRAHRIATRAPLAVEATKAAVGRAPDLDADGARALQASHFTRLAGTRDHRDAVRGVLDRRPAVFTRR